MATYLDIPASLAYLQSIRPAFSSLQDAIAQDPVAGYSRTSRAEARFRGHSPDFSHAERLVRQDLLLPGLPEGPVGIVVSSAADKRASSRRHSTIWSGSVPRGSFISIGDDAYICSPGFCFLKLAHVLSPVKHIEFGLRLCGCFPLVDGLQAPTTPTFWAPVTSAALLRRYLDGAGEAFGEKRALRSLRYVLDHAASVRECEMAMCVHLPLRMGGYGIRDVALNDIIPASEEARWVSGMSRFIVDLHLFDAHVAMEYDSEQNHSGANAHAKDAVRRGGISTMGIHVVTVTNEQLKSQWKMDRVMTDVAHAGRIRLRPRGYDHVARRIELHQELFGVA